MTKDQILQLARDHEGVPDMYTFYGDELVEFTAKIREEERERLCEMFGTLDSGPIYDGLDWLIDMMRGVK
jgi:hypothetical protein